MCAVMVISNRKRKMKELGSRGEVEGGEEEAGEDGEVDSRPREEEGEEGVSLSLYTKKTRERKTMEMEKT